MLSSPSAVDRDSATRRCCAVGLEIPPDLPPLGPETHCDSDNEEMKDEVEALQAQLMEEQRTNVCIRAFTT